MTHPQVEAAADAFSTALVQWRAQRRMSKKQLAAQMGFDPSYVSHVEARRHRPTEDFARRAEAVLESGGLIWQRFRDYDEARQSVGVSDKAPRAVTIPAPRMPTSSRPATSRVAVERWVHASAGPVIEVEESTLVLANGAYRCEVRRQLYNAGDEPVTRYPIRVAVDRYPGEPDRSNRHHRDHPLTWAELNLTARCDDEEMHWRCQHDRDAFKEIWLLFENEQARFPLYPGHRAVIEYGYTVGADKWGPWFQRVVRVPTRRLSLRLDLPAAARPVVWGVAGSLTAEARPLQTPVSESTVDDRRVFEWSTESPPLNSRYRLEWRLRAEESPILSAGAARQRPSEAMRRLGIVQRGAPVLERAARWLDLPDQATLAGEVVGRLREALDRLVGLRPFPWGVALSAPQLGIGWAVSVLQPAEAQEPTILLNPRIVAESVDHEERLEGCLSFLDVRGKVSRPLLVEVEHSTLEGETLVSTFTGALARAAAHSVDHLGGLLYSDRMPADGRLVPADAD
jgi:peptide deformylase/transcriptional regulator with XRE-family HTH domain